MVYTIFVTKDGGAIVTKLDKADAKAENELLEANGYKAKTLMRSESFANSQTLQVWLDYCKLPLLGLLEVK